MEQYYRLLGLSPTADLEQVKKAYRKLAKAYHPDMNPDPRAVALFQQIQQAYEWIVQYQTNPNPYGANPWAAYAPYGANTYPPQPWGYGYQPPYGQTQQSQQSPPTGEDSAFKAYSWESWDDSSFQQSYTPPPTEHKKQEQEKRKQTEEEAAPPTTPQYEVPLRGDILQIAQEEAIAEAKLRLKGEKLSELEQWEADVEYFLLHDRNYIPVANLSATTRGNTTTVKRGDSSLLGMFFQMNSKGKK